MIIKDKTFEQYSSTVCHVYFMKYITWHRMDTKSRISRCNFPNFFLYLQIDTHLNRELENLLGEPSKVATVPERVGAQSRI